MRLDFIFMPLYFGALSLGVFWAARRLLGRWPTVAWVVGVTGCAAALFAVWQDIRENRLLLRVLASPSGLASMWTPQPCQAKFSTVLALTGFILVGPVVGWALMTSGPTQEDLQKRQEHG
ncbi:MAG: hypothetical protein U0X73_12720 [Thermoanaerobaculia bacterium]